MNNRKSLSNLSLVCLIACLALLGCSFGVGNTSNTTNNTSNTSNGGNNRSPSNSASPSTNASPSGNSSSRGNANGGGAPSNSPGGTTGGAPGGGPGGAPGGGGSSGTTTSVRVLNESRYAIHYLYLSSTSESNWGQDQLGQEIIAAGGNYTITNVPCGNYDVKIVDQDRDECEVRNVRFCTDQNVLRITNEELLRCEGYGR